MSASSKRSRESVYTNEAKESRKANVNKRTTCVAMAAHGEVRERNTLVDSRMSETVKVRGAKGGMRSASSANRIS